MFMRSTYLKAYGLLILTTLIWAGNSVAGKIGAGHVDPILLTTLRWAIASAIILAFSIKPLRRDWPVIRQYGLLLLAYGVFGFGLFNMVLYSALNHTSAINVMIEQAGIPLVIFIGNFALFRLKVAGSQLIGFCLTFFGVLLAATHGHVEQILHMKLNTGDALMLLGMVIYGGYSVALKWRPPLHWQSLLAVPCIGALLACLPALWWRMAQAPLPVPDATGWAVVAYAFICVALISSVTYIFAIDLIGSNRAGLFINLLPIFGVFLAVIILREPLHGFHLIALGLVSGGIVLSEWKRFAGTPDTDVVN
ncbi:MAG: DMT family transporter [Asticcacaulis sp.]